MEKFIDEVMRSGICFTRRQVLDDLAQLVLNTLSVSCPFIAFHPEAMDALDRYATHPEAWEALQGAAMKYMEASKAEPFAGVLGKLYDQELGLEQGQFMTPPALGSAALRFLGAQDSGTKVCDPTCGTGVLLLTAMKANHQRSFYGNDINLAVLKIAACDIITGAVFHNRCPNEVVLTCSDVIRGYNSGFEVFRMTNPV